RPPYFFELSDGIRNSTLTKVSSPTTQPSCPGGMLYASPALMSCSFPSSDRTCKRPDMANHTWWVWQESVPTSCSTAFDHLHPGWNVKRPMVSPATVTISALPLSEV